MSSTAIQRFDYDLSSRTLSVWFVPSGSRQGYVEVPAALVEAFRRATSKGRFVKARVRDHFAYRRVALSARCFEPNSATVAEL